MIHQGDLYFVLSNTVGVWEKLKNKTIFLTGGTGFFGKWLMESFIYANNLLQLNAKMIVLSRDPELFIEQFPHFNDKCIDFIKGDVSSFLYPTQSIDYIIHAASDANVALKQEQSLQLYYNLVEGTRHILELARIKKVEAVLHTSSGAVYGKQPTNLALIPEDYIGATNIYDKGAAYGEGKRVAEMMAKIYFDTYGIPSKIARCFAFVGPYLPLDVHFAIGNFIKDALNDNKIIVNGDGTPYRSYLYAADLTVWLWHILLFGKNCYPYNVGSDEAITIASLAQKVAAYTTCNQTEILMPKTNQPPARYIPDISRAKQELNMKVGIGIDVAIQKTIEFYKKYST